MAAERPKLARGYKRRSPTRSNWAHFTPKVCGPRHPSVWAKKAKRFSTRQETNSTGGPALSNFPAEAPGTWPVPTAIESGWLGRGWGWASRRLWLQRSDSRTPPSSAPSELEIKIKCVKQRPQITLQRNLQHLPGRLQPRLPAKSRRPTRLPQPGWAVGATPQPPPAWPGSARRRRRRRQRRLRRGRGRGQTGAHARALPRGTPAGRPALSWRRARAAAAAANMAETSEEVAVLVQRVVKDITNAFRRNPHMWVPRRRRRRLRRLGGSPGAGRGGAEPRADHWGHVPARATLAGGDRSRSGARLSSAAAGPAFRYRNAPAGESLEVTSENHNGATFLGLPPTPSLGLHATRRTSRVCPHPTSV